MKRCFLFYLLVIIGLTVDSAMAVSQIIISAEGHKKAEGSSLTLQALVKESLTKKDLVGAKVKITDNQGNVLDTCVAKQIQSVRVDGGGNYSADYSSMFRLKVPRTAGDYMIEVTHEGYSPALISVKVDKIGRREFTRTIDNIFLTRAPKDLEGITVTASKIKFYNRGDTIVFNADAFELAEGSMLDALIKQLPGVELKEGGQIYVNGEFVQNLMLNGKDFFKGNNELMLDNIAAYTVKDVEVYKRQTEKQKFVGSNAPGELTLDVKLKKEYNQGWIFNLEAGVGTSDRYMGRAFINRFTTNSRLTLVGNVNNLNDNRKPGEASTWTPQSNTVGTMKTQMAALDYRVENPATNFKINGNAMFRHSSQHDRRDVNRINFLPSGDTYDYSFGRNSNNNLMLSTYHNLEKSKPNKYYQSLYLTGSYNRITSHSSNNSVSLMEENPNITSAWIDSLYSSSPTTLDEIINRMVTRTVDFGHSEYVSASYWGSVYVPGTEDNISTEVGVVWNGSKNRISRDYIVNYGSDPTPAIRENQYYDNSPNNNFNINASTSYYYRFNQNTTLGLRYSFAYKHTNKDSYRYTFDRLNDMDIYGYIPCDFISYDPENSYQSTLNNRTNSISLNFSYRKDNTLYIWFTSQLNLVNNDLRYFRNNRTYAVAQHATTFLIQRGTASIVWQPGEPVGERKVKRNSFRFEGGVTPSLPDMYRMVDITDDNDPMNIWVGNPDLKTAYSFNGQLSWTYKLPVKASIFSNTIDLIGEAGHNNIVNGYTYDMQTGVRTNKAYNVATGNNVFKIHEFANLQFGSKQQFTVWYRGGIDFIKAADMIGTNVIEPEKSIVNTVWDAHTLDFSWQIGKQQIGARAGINRRHTTSDRANFNAINATEGIYTLRGQFKLPYGWGINTDLAIYSRSGYGSKELDRTDPVWNLAVSFTPRKSKFVFMLDGFDMLHRLSNVNYAVNAQGRTVTFRNVLPRYFLFHIQYRLNIQPKKKMINNTKSGKNWEELFK